MKTILTSPQQIVVDKFNGNSMFDCCIHKHRRSKAWFQVQSRSWFPVSDQTIKSLVKIGFLKQVDDYRWIKNS